MLIANPIYDVVFKYLMEDAKVAKLLIGSIIDCEIMELEFRPKSFTAKVSRDSDVDAIEDLKEKRRNELEILLSVFDQSNQTGNQHILNVQEEDFPEQFRPIIRRLQKAVEVPEIRDNMEAEDTILEEFENQERRALDAEKIAVEAQLREQDALQREQEALLQIAQEKQRAEQAEQEALQLKQELEALRKKVSTEESKE